MHAALRASLSPHSFWSALLLSPQSLASSYWPTMQGDEFLEIMQSMREFVAWYKCPKGHPCAHARRLAKAARGLPRRHAAPQGGALQLLQPTPTALLLLC